MFLESPASFSHALHIITVVACPLHIFGCYCILFKTPKVMNTVKLTMLNLHVWCMLLDWGLTVFAVPFLLFPAMAGFPLGIWTSVFGISAFVQCYFIVTWIYTAGIGIALIFENRYYHISGRNGVWRQYRVPFIVLNYFLNITFLIPAMSRIPEQTGALNLVFEQLPSLSAEIKTYSIYVLSNEYFWVLFPFYSMAGLVIGESFVFCGLIYRNLNSNYGITRSRNTTTLQKKFLRAMYSQVAVLVFSFVFPALYVSFAMIFNYYNQSGNNIVFIILALHGISSTVVMLWAHKPYRTVCRKFAEELQLRVRLLNIPQERRPPRIVISVVF